MANPAKLHHHLAPSAAHRWLVCSAEPALRASVPNTTSSYAAEGTTAHWVAEQCLRTGRTARHYINQRCPETLQIVPEEMAEPVQFYVDHCNAIKGSAWHAIEEKFTLPEISPDLGGTCDFASVTNTTLQVRDLKFGTGYAVAADNNPQLMIYALGAYHRLIETSPEVAKKVGSVLYGIVQPRLDEEKDRIKLAKITVGDLIVWENKELKKAVARTEDLNDQTLVAGPHCRFCPAKAVCPAQHAEAQNQAMVDFADVPIASPRIETLTPEKLARVLAAKDDLVSWLNAVEAAAQNILEQGGAVPGFKLVAKRANRAWADDALAEKKLVGLLGDDAWVAPKLISVAQAEKALKFLDMDVPEELVTRPDTGRIIAPESDRRPAVTCSAVADFAEAPLPGAEGVKVLTDADIFG